MALAQVYDTNSTSFRGLRGAATTHSVPDPAMHAIGTALFMNSSQAGGTMRKVQRFCTVGVLAALLTCGLGVREASAGFGLGIKGGPIWPNFSSADIDLNNNTGWQAGFFFDGGRSNLFSV